MNRVLQVQKDALQAFQENIQPGRVAGLLLYFSGTAAATKTGVIGDCGSVVINRNGVTIVNRPISFFQQMGDIRKGSNLFASATAGAFKATVFIPFYELGLEQAMSIEKVNELNIQYTPSASAASQFDALNLEVYSQTSDLPELYQYYILGDDQTVSAAVSSRPFTLNRSNITSLYIGDPDTKLTKLGVRQNGAEKFSEQPKDVLLAGTLYDNMLEVTNFDLVLLRTYTIGARLSTLNNNTVYVVTTSGAGTVEVTYCAIEWYS